MRMLVGMLAAVMMVVVPSAAGVGQEHAPGDCDGAVLARPHPDAGGTPVIFVHGAASSAAAWEQPLMAGTRPVTNSAGEPLSMLDRTAQTGAAVYTFDYRQQGMRWVTDADIGPRLAQALVCLYEAFGQRVQVVAHSMGGLATRFAVNQPWPQQQLPPPGNPTGLVADAVDHITTLGTPYQGSELLAAIQHLLHGLPPPSPGPAAAVMMLARQIVAECGRLGQTDATSACWLLSTLDAPVGSALLPDSDQLRELPSWPDGPEVLAYAGQVIWESSIFGHHIRSVPIGDGVVSTSSATADHPNHHIEQCRTATPITSSQLCLHIMLPRNDLVFSHVAVPLRAGASGGLRSSKT